MEERRALARDWLKRCDVCVMLGFDHDASELLSAGVAEHDATFFAERGLARRGRGKLPEGYRAAALNENLHVDDELR